MIAGLSDLLRRVLEDEGRQQVPLGEEMEFLERYLDIQRARFAERLRVAIDVPAELHIFTGAGHGFGVRETNHFPAGAWPDRFREWLADRGFLGAVH